LPAGNGRKAAAAIGAVRGKDGGLRANALPRALRNVMALGAAALMAFGASSAFAVDLRVAYVTPAELTPSTTAPPPVLPLRPSFSVNQPALTNDLLQAYVAKQLAFKKQIDGVDLAPPTGSLTPALLLGYIDRTRAAGADNLALNAIDAAAGQGQAAIDPSTLSTYAQHYVFTPKKVQVANSEKLCLTQAIYHEARGESVAGQWAVANVIINRANSHRFPATLCGVVYQNADQGYHRCQFTFACDGRPEVGTERVAWTRAQQMAAVAYKEFKSGQTPGVLPNSAMYYHTTAVEPSWSNDYKRVATIGAHEFYSPN
jgi:spore germination cell wall hydrolase CwlJ-like protein